MNKYVRLAILCIARVAVLLIWAHPTLAREQGKNPLVRTVEAIGITVSDMDRSVDFYTRVLSFEKVSDVEVSGHEYEVLKGLYGLRVRVVRMKLGGGLIELSQFITPPGGRPVPMDSRSHDLWFQHMAIVVRDMDEAYSRLRRYRIRHVSTQPQTIPQSNQAAAGIRAFKFRDPDDHNLELLYFPDGKGDPRWRRSINGLFLGIDHTAISISNTESSLKFYRDLLGLKVVGKSLNTGIEQEQLDNLKGATVRVTGLRPGTDPPGIEFLEYLNPLDRRPIPLNTKANDLWNWQIRLVVTNVNLALKEMSTAGYRVVSTAVAELSGQKSGLARGLLVLDPDGHQILLIEK